MHRPGRVLACILAFGCLAVASCGSESSSAVAFRLPLPSDRVQTVTVQAITFSYPWGWPRTQWDQSSSFTYMVAAISNHSLKTPCTHYAGGWSCGPPVDSLQPGTLMVMWWQNAFPTWTLDAQAGEPTSVAGLPAKVQDPAHRQLVCPSLGADSALRVQIERPGVTSNYFQFDACFKGPGVEAEKSEAQAILSSAHFWS